MTSVDNSHLRLIDPIFIQAKLRAEFRLPADSVFQSNLRILGTSITSSATDSYSPLLVQTEQFLLYIYTMVPNYLIVLLISTPINLGTT